MNTIKTSPFTQLVTHLTQGNAKQKKRVNSFNVKKTIQLRTQRNLMLQLAQKVFYAQNKYIKYQQQFNQIACELLTLIKQDQNTNTSEQLNTLIKKYQRLIKLIMLSIMGGTDDGTTPKLQMPIFNNTKDKTNYEDAIKKINHLLEKKSDLPQPTYESIGDAVVNIIIGIFSFFISSLELDEENKNELDKELTKYKKQQQNINLIFAQTVSVLNDQLKATQLELADQQPTRQNTNHPLLNPLNLVCRPVGGSSTNKKK